MLLKKLLMVCCILLVAIASNAQKRQKVDINEATVFLNGAELFSSTNISLTSGETEILFTNVAGNVNQQSLSIGAGKDVVVQSAVFQNNYLENDNLSPRAQEIKDSIDQLEGKRSNVNNELTVVNEQVNILSQNKKVAGEQSGLSVEELTKMLDLVKGRLGKLLDEKDKLLVRVKDIDEDLKKLRQQLQEEKRKGFQPGGQLLVKFYSAKATNTKVTLSYVVPNAGWSPSYDLRVDDISSPVNLFYKAHVYQNSGVSWDKIKLSLSTGNPYQGAQAPNLNPWYLSFYTPRPYAYSNQVYNNGLGSAKRSTKDYIVDGAQVASADEMREEASIDNYVHVNNSGVNTVFDIDLTYTIPSDGKQHNVSIKEYKLPATYRYFAVPKLDCDAFLQAQVTDWEDLNLLPAPTNIFYEGTYVGQGYIDMRNVKDTMNLSLGRDKKVVIRRERDKELRSVRTIGSNVKETFVYKITVRNTRNKTVDLVLMDQLPISNDKDIEIDDKIYDSATYNETTGAVTWKLQLSPNETKEVKVGFTAKYPKGKQINL